MNQQKKLPIGIQSLGEMIEGGYYYVDKTDFVHQLVNDGKYFFLSRPRRFGKSLFLDTLKELFEGNQTLFKDLYIHDRWDWQNKYPVIRLSFGSGTVRNREELDRRIEQQLIEIRADLGLPESSALDIAGNFATLIRQASELHGAKAVVLIDEYDKPILDNISEQDKAIEAREGLKNLYSVLKDSDPYLHFCMLTGVSKFSKVSLFSGLNNLRDITLSNKYSAICGYTDRDIDQTFAHEVAGLDRKQIQFWYNGYNWGGDAVYNPFDVLLLFKERDFRSFWFESATPTFLVKLLSERQFFTPKLANLYSSEALLSRFDVQDISNEALLFQAGYLTLKKVEEITPGKKLYTLTYPNHEVQTSLNEALLPALGLASDRALENGLQLLSAFRSSDFSALEKHFKALFASLPHDWYRNNAIDQYEGHYASVFYSHLAALGLDLTVEDSSSTGQVDLMLNYHQKIFLFEFKTVADQPEGKALQQLQDKNYAAKYQDKGLPIYQVGVEFSKQQRQIVAFDVLT